MEELTVRYRLQLFPLMNDLDMLLLSTINIAHSVLFLMLITVHSSNKLIRPTIACFSCIASRSLGHGQESIWQMTAYSCLK